MRYLPILLIVVGCSQPGDEDAGSLESPDGGPQFTCMPGAVFCIMGEVWTCTLESHDATLTDTCYRADGPGFAAEQGYCSETRCDGGSFEPFGDGGVSCCYP